MYKFREISRKCSTQKSANESRGLCYSYGDCLWEGRPKGGLKPISKIPKIASNNVNTATLSKKTGVSISQVKAGKQAANVAANRVAAAVKEAATQTVKKCPPGCSPCPPECPCPAVAAGGGRSRRRYAKNEARAGPRRRRRSRRR